MLTLINAEFLQYVVDFFKRIACAKLDNENVTVDWYKKELLCSDSLTKEEIAVHSGLNMKTISNMYNSASKPIVLEASLEHYDALYDAINSLTEQDNIDMALTIKFRDVSVDLNINESLIVINTLAVKRSALRGGLWSTAGKQVEKPLMIALCAFFQVPKKYFNQKTLSISHKPFDKNLQEALDKILPAILSDDVQDSVTPEVVLIESEQDDDSGSQLLVEF